MIGYIVTLGLLLEQGHYVPDLWADSSAEIYIGPDHSLSDRYYVPEFLVDVPTTQSIIPTKSLQLRVDALISLTHMSQEMYEDLGLPLVIISAYRSHNYQQQLIDQFGDGNLRAKPGHSEHQLGLAIDVMGLSNAHMESDTDASRIYQWLVNHGYEYGRHQSYQYGLATDGYYPEKRHRRYVGPALAKYLKNSDQTLTQYFYQMIRPIDSLSGDPLENPPHVFSSRIVAPVKAYKTPPMQEKALPLTEGHQDSVNELFLHPL